MFWSDLDAFCRTSSFEFQAIAATANIAMTSAITVTLTLRHHGLVLNADGFNRFTRSLVT